MFYEENNFTDEQREIIRNYDGDVEFLYCQRLELFCDIRTGAFNAGEDNYIRIFNGEDWKDVAREIAEDYNRMKNSKWEYLTIGNSKINPHIIPQWAIVGVFFG